MLLIWLVPLEQCLLCRVAGMDRTRRATGLAVGVEQGPDVISRSVSQ
jgi:hypothetical protein